VAGGYTVASGNWGNVDVLAGYRMLAVNETTDFSLAAVITRPDGSVALGRSGKLSAGRTIWNGIGGIRGRFYLGDADWFGGGRFYLPFYFDVGGGGSHPTWQAFGGIGYQTRLVGLTLGYRYLSFQQGGSGSTRMPRAQDHHMSVAHSSSMPKSDTGVNLASPEKGLRNAVWIGPIPGA